jgi:dephospho-CoA kinase
MADKRKPVIGLVGGIGSGKSWVAQRLADHGGAVFDADRVAKAALDEPDVQRCLVEHFGSGVVGSDGRTDRKALAEVVFTDAGRRKQLEQIIHPIVAERRDAMIERAEADPEVRFVVLDVPLLVEVGLYERCDRVVFVDADRPTRLRRVAESRGWDEAELTRREKNQLPLDKKRGCEEGRPARRRCTARARWRPCPTGSASCRSPEQSYLPGPDDIYVSPARSAASAAPRP